MMLVIGVDFLAKLCTIFATARCDFFISFLCYSWFSGTMCLRRSFIMIFDLFSLLFLVLWDDRSAAEFHTDFRSLFFVVFGFL
jgi:hypothetical protein